MQIYHTKILNQFTNLIVCFTNKLDGNLAFHVGDKKESVCSNHKKLSKKLQYDYKKLIFMQQIHSNTIQKVEDNNNFFNPPTADALITNKKNTPLMVMVADCAPILLYDPLQKVIAVVHAGRAGAFNNILQEVLDSFQNDFNAEMKDIIVCIGAHIHACCYEVGEEIYQEAKNLHLEFAIQRKDNSYFLDISLILQSQLYKMGILKNNVQHSTICTACATHEYFSYRKEKNTGRFAAVIMLK